MNITTDHRQGIFDQLARHEHAWGVQAEVPQALRTPPDRLKAFRSFIASTPHCFERSWTAGHVTGSALVLSSDLQRVLLTHHRKLGKWLQLGGHADGDPDAAAVAMKEAEEESGMKALRFWRTEPFDLDHHEIPATIKEPAHIHWDVRYVLVAPLGAAPVLSEESMDLRWFTLAEARRVTDEPSMLRQFDKIEWLRGLPQHKGRAITP